MLRGAACGAHLDSILYWSGVAGRVHGATCPNFHGAAAKWPARSLNNVPSGQAVGSQTRMRAAPSTTRAAILISRKRSVLNSARAHTDRVGAADRRVCNQPIGGGVQDQTHLVGAWIATR